MQKGRIFSCDCGKSFLSLAALNQHKKYKHDILLNNKGRPRKYPLTTENENFEENFFKNNIRSHIEGEIFDIHNIVYQVFDFIYRGKFSNKLFFHPKKMEENKILKNLYENAPNSNKLKNLKNCDEVCYEYLQEIKNKTNKKYFSFLLKFIILFNEYYYLNKTQNIKENEINKIIEALSPNDFPDISNDFYSEFLEKNNFFDLFKDVKKENENEIIENILYFCHWLFKNGYTEYKISIKN